MLNAAPLALLLLASGPDDGLRLDAGLFAALPTALGNGQLLGPSLGARWDLGAWAFAFKARLGFVEENDLVWQLSHTELRLSLGAARVWRFGRGALSLGLYGGGLMIAESRLRHQADRLAAAGLETQASALASAPFAGLEAALRAYFYDPLWLSVEGGPTVAWVQVEDQASLRPGWLLGISFGYAFGREGED